MNFIDFHKKFKTESNCIKYLKEKREKEGICCKKCQNKKHYWIASQKHWRCSECKTKTHLKSGTIMQDSKLPLMYWFLTIHLMTTTKKSFSALELQRQLGHKRYLPIWYMMQKVRIVMGNRDAEYKLTGSVEIDDAYFETVNLKRDNSAVVKRGRGTDRKSTVLVMTESTANTGKISKHRPNRILGYVKMIVTDDLKAVGINYEVKKGVNNEARVMTDGYNGYNSLNTVVPRHIAMTVPPEQAHKKLPWVHMTISNAKRLLLGVHHSIGKEYLQNYLNEFCFKLNRRYTNEDIFDKMIRIGVKNVWYK